MDKVSLLLCASLLLVNVGVVEGQCRVINFFGCDQNSETLPCRLLGTCALLRDFMVCRLRLAVWFSARRLDRSLVLLASVTIQAPPRVLASDCGSPAPPPRGSVSVECTEVGCNATHKCDEGFDLFGDNVTTCQQTGAWTSTPNCSLPLPVDCGAVETGVNGVYKIRPAGAADVISVFCDLETDDYAWTVFQRRYDGSEEFDRGWAEYELGFGDREGEFWLGNKNLHSITNQGPYKLSITMKEFDGSVFNVQYDKFRVGSAESEYELTISGYSGNGGDDMSNLDGKRFSTRDNDNDGNMLINCAELMKSGWWANEMCPTSNLNGEYRGVQHEANSRGLIWYNVTGISSSLYFVEMKMLLKVYPKGPDAVDAY
ncbi:hypothetical protein ScPMuIL_013570 [Solemya velum]